MDMHLLHTSLEAIECICTQEKASTQSEKAFNKGEIATSDLAPSLWPESQKKLARTSIAAYARGMGAHTQCTIQNTVIV